MGWGERVSTTGPYIVHSEAVYNCPSCGEPIRFGISGAVKPVTPKKEKPDG